MPRVHPERRRFAADGVLLEARRSSVELRRMEAWLLYLGRMVKYAPGELLAPLDEEWAQAEGRQPQDGWLALVVEDLEELRQAVLPGLAPEGQAGLGSW
eukprot:15473750-Alexandrium_andersonii.AAC.1